MKRTFTVEIAGARYRMTSDAGEDHIRRLAEIVNERIEALGPKAARAASPAQLLAVVALALAEDLLTSEERRQKIEEKTRNAVQQAIERIDRRLRIDAQTDES